MLWSVCGFFREVDHLFYFTVASTLPPSHLPSTGLERTLFSAIINLHSFVMYNM